MSNEFGAGSRRYRAIAFIADGTTPIRLDGELLRRTFELSHAEIRLAETLTAGMTIDEMAKEIGLSRKTIKTQLQASMPRPTPIVALT